MHYCLEAGLAAALPAHLGLGLPGWAAALGLVGHLALGRHAGCHHQQCLAWERLASGLGVWADLHVAQ